jgi:hypothetical protein
MEEIVIAFEGQYIKVTAHGGGYDYAKRLWSLVRDASDEHRCYSVLGIGHTISLDTMEAFNHAQLFMDLGITHKFRIAWVETNPEIKDMIAFTETVLMNRSLPGRLFTNVAEAEEWLLKDDA